MNEGYKPSYIRALTGHTYRTIRKYKEGDPDVLCRSTVVGRSRASKLDPFEALITEKIIAGMILKEIFELIIEKGYDGKPTQFYTYCKKLMEEKDIAYHTRTNIAGKPINRTKLNIYYIHRKDVLTDLWTNQKLNIQDKEYIFEKYPLLVELQSCVKDFKELFNIKCTDELIRYLEKYRSTDIKKIKTFIEGLYKDLEAIKQAVISPLSNGYVEGNNSRLKMIKRMMYGRAGLELLKAKVML